METELNDEELRAIRQRYESASPGPWRSWVEGRDHTSGDDFIMVGEGAGRQDDMYVTREGTPAAPEDLDFIAAARQDIPRLLAEVNRLRALLHGNA